MDKYYIVLLIVCGAIVGNNYELGRAQDHMQTQLDAMLSDFAGCGGKLLTSAVTMPPDFMKPVHRVHYAPVPPHKPAVPQPRL